MVAAVDECGVEAVEFCFEFDVVTDDDDDIPEVGFAALVFEVSTVSE